MVVEYIAGKVAVLQDGQVIGGQEVPQPKVAEQKQPPAEVDQYQYAQDQYQPSQDQYLYDGGQVETPPQEQIDPYYMDMQQPVMDPMTDVQPPFEQDPGMQGPPVDIPMQEEALREALEEKERWRKLAISHARTIAELEALLS